MKRYLILSLFVIAKLSFAAPPEGLSSWAYSYCQTPEIQDREHCAPFSAELTVLYKDGQICGEISESWFPKSPSAGFFSSDFRKDGVVKFADSFQQNEKDFGLATLKFSDKEAEWKVLKSPHGGLVGDASKLKRQEPRGRTPSSCAEAKEFWDLPVE